MKSTKGHLGGTAEAWGSPELRGEVLEALRALEAGELENDELEEIKRSLHPIPPEESHGE